MQPESASALLKMTVYTQLMGFSGFCLNIKFYVAHTVVLTPFYDLSTAPSLKVLYHTQYCRFYFTMRVLLNNLRVPRNTEENDRLKTLQKHKKDKKMRGTHYWY